MRILKSGLAAVAAIGLLGLGSQLRADTINVDGLNFLGGSAPSAQWEYTTDMTATGAATDNTDSFTILNVQGFVDFDATHATAETFTDAAGNKWNAVATPAGSTTTITVTYASGPTTEFGANLANTFGNLVDINFTDKFTARGAGANWTSKDHGVTGTASGGLALTGSSETSAGVIDTPVPSGVPLPASALGGIALMGVLALRRKSSRKLD